MPGEYPVLLVEDNELNREILKEILGEEHRILEAENGQEALDILAEYGGDIAGVVLDLNMPVMDGYTFLQHYSQHPEWAEIPVLVATADTSAGMENRCLELGACDFVLKPYNPAVVRLRLQNNISRRQMNQLERQRILDVFQRYEDPAIVEELLNKGTANAELESRMLRIAVLFVDIRGFTTLSEKLPPQQIVEILDEFLSLAAQCIKKYGGTLDKFMGDCAMAFWGAPNPCEDPVYPACQAALDMVRESETFSEKMYQKIGHRVPCGVGIHVGPAVVGNIGTSERMDYTAIGDTVNTASRLESAAPPGTIYISRAVADSLGSKGKTTSLGSVIRLKGKAEDMEILTLDGLTEQP